MKTCRNEGLIDGYLLGKLNAKEAEEFEKHYFECSPCFAKLAERDDILGVLKNDRSVFAVEEQPAIEAKRAAWYDRAVAFFTPRQWVLAGAAAALLVALLTVTPLFRNAPPEFVLNGEETVRGSSLTLISPVIDIASVPAYFEWRKLGADVEYQVSIYNGKLLWKTTTRENRLSLPEDVKAKMIAGQRYSWQVKAFTREGTLIAASSRVQFTIHK
jgi:hypothetical protein